MVLEKTLESSLDCKEIKPVNPKGNQSWIFIGRTDAEAPILWPSDAKNWPLRKYPDAGKDWRQEDPEISPLGKFLATLDETEWYYFYRDLREIRRLLKASLPDLVIHHPVMIKLQLGLYGSCRHAESLCSDLEMLIKATNMQLTCNMKGLLSTFLKEIGSFFRSFQHLYQFLRIYGHLWFWIDMKNVSNVCSLNGCWLVKHNLLFCKLDPKKHFRIDFINWYLTYHILAGAIDHRIFIK